MAMINCSECGKEISDKAAVCAGCAPPLGYSGGPVAATGSRAGLVVVPVYWEPRGGRYTFPPGFESTVDRFIANAAAASGSADDVFSVATEYYSDQFGVKTPVRDDLSAGRRIVDSDPFPPSGCKPAEGYGACITDAQLRTELRDLTRTRRLPIGLGHMYAVFFPPEVETAGSDGTNSIEDFCAYHSSFISGRAHILYDNAPYDERRCGFGQAPNGNAIADADIGVLSHEVIEVMTDPINEPRAWDDKTGNEVADLCAATFGRPLGSTNPRDRAATEYNQVIHGGRYYLPQEFSNTAFERFGLDRGCVLSEKIARSATAAAIGKLDANPQAFLVDATPTSLSGNGTATSTIVAHASGSAGTGLAGDHVHFDVEADSGRGQCGTLDSGDRVTGPDGRVSVTYTASKDDVDCWVLAVDAEGGRSAAAAIYQGKDARTSPTLEASFPSTLNAGAAPAQFTVTAANSSASALPETITHLAIYAGATGTAAVKAGEVHVSYSANGPKGKFAPVPLAGSTARGNAIQGYLGPLRGTAIAAHASEKLTVRVSLDHGVPVSRTRPLLAFHAYLDETNPASGSDATIADSNETSVVVPVAVASSHTLRNVLIGVGVVLVLLAIAGRARRGTGRSRRGAPGRDRRSAPGSRSGTG